jgi:hypothetical protein
MGTWRPRNGVGQRSMPWFGRHRYVARTAWLLLAVAALLALLVVTLGPLSWLLAGGSVRRLQGKDQADALNPVRQTVLTALGGAAALVALGFTVRTYYLSTCPGAGRSPIASARPSPNWRRAISRNGWVGSTLWNRFAWLRRVPARFARASRAQRRSAPVAMVRAGPHLADQHGADRLR